MYLTQHANRIAMQETVRVAAVRRGTGVRPDFGIV